MAIVDAIESNVTGLRIAEEVSFGVLPGTPEWILYEPNSYSDFGGNLSLTPRNPINPDRQRKKGVITDLEAAGGFATDVTQSNLQDILQGFVLADFRPKGEETPTEATATTDLFDVAATAGFLVGDLILVKGFVNAANNGIHEITAVVLDTTIEVLGSTLVTETPPATATIVNVGLMAGTADIDVDAAGAFPALTSTVLSFDVLGLNVGEFIFIGGDPATSDFANAENNGFKRIRSIAAKRLEFDKSAVAMTTETGSGIDLELYFGRVLKNELAASIVKRTYQMERLLGAPDDALPAEIQSEYVTKAFPNQIAFNIPNSDKMTADLTFLAGDHEQRTGATGVKTGNRPTLEDADAFNTSSDFSRIKINVHSDTDDAPAALFAFMEELTLTLNNNGSQSKAVSVLGAFAIPAGTLELSGSITGYFADVAAVTAIRNNSDVTFDFAVAKNNAGWVIDLPLVALGDGRLNVEQDQSIKIPLTMDAATAKKIDPNLDHTIMFVFFDYLPTAAE